MRTHSFVCAALLAAAAPAAAQDYTGNYTRDRAARAVITSPASPREISGARPSVTIDPRFPLRAGRMSADPAPQRDLATRPLITRPMPLRADSFRPVNVVETYVPGPAVITSAAWYAERERSPHWSSTRHYTPTRFRAWRMDDPPIIGYPIGDR